jgi:homocitrate synthase NifV
VAAGKSIVGDAVFWHESGIHVDGLLKDRSNYEVFQPEELGREHRLVLGKHSGAHGVRHAFARLGLVLDAEDVPALLLCIRAHVARHKREPSDAELRLFHCQVCARATASAVRC